MLIRKFFEDSVSKTCNLSNIKNIVNKFINLLN